MSVHNGIDTRALDAFTESVRTDPSKGAATFGVVTTWAGGTHTRTEVRTMTLGGQTIRRGFEIEADEPVELFGTNRAPNPQELLMAAINACVTVGIVANAAAMGIAIRALRIRLTGTLDLRGFLGLDASVNPAYDALQYAVEIDSDATDAELGMLHESVRATSPNFNNMRRAVAMNGDVKRMT